MTWDIEQPVMRAFVERYRTGDTMPITRDFLRRNDVDPAGLDWARIENAKDAYAPVA